MNKKILITGGLGFIGSTLIKSFLDTTDHSIINLDKNTYASSRETLIEYEDKKNYVYENKDICSSEEVEEIFIRHKPDLVFHLAAESHVDNSIENPIDFLNTNILGTYNLLISSMNLYKEKKEKDFIFHHVSTDEVYGDLGPRDKAFTEISNYQPSSPYSATKASSDHLVRAWNRTYNLPTIITNCSNNYGPFQNKEKLIPKTIFNAMNLNMIPIYGSGNQIRDWLHVDDHVSALRTVAFSSSPSDTFNIGGGNQITNLELVETICSLMDEIIPIDETQNISAYRELISFVQDRPGHDNRYAIDSTKIYNELKWKPQLSLTQGLRETVLWYISNPQWLSQSSLK